MARYGGQISGLFPHGTDLIRSVAEKGRVIKIGVQANHLLHKIRINNSNKNIVYLSPLNRIEYEDVDIKNLQVLNKKNGSTKLISVIVDYIYEI